MDMVTIGVDAHKHSHTAVAVDPAGRRLAERTVPATSPGHLELVRWATRFAERRWAIEDCRHLSRRLSTDLLPAGETVVPVPPKLMAGARRSSRERGKSDPIDALAVARAALREDLPRARLDGPERDVRLLVDHRDDLVAERTRIENRLRWHLHELEPGSEPVARSLDRAVVLDRLERPSMERTAAGEDLRIGGAADHQLHGQPGDRPEHRVDDRVVGRAGEAEVEGEVGPHMLDRGAGPLEPRQGRPQAVDVRIGRPFGGQAGGLCLEHAAGLRKLAGGDPAVAELEIDRRGVGRRPRAADERPPARIDLDETALDETSERLPDDGPARPEFLGPATLGGQPATDRPAPLDDPLGQLVRDRVSRASHQRPAVRRRSAQLVARRHRCAGNTF